jgi:hypothetical protein
VTGYGTFTNPGPYPLEMNTDFAVSFTSTEGGSAVTSQAGVYPSDPSQLGLVPGNTTIDVQQDIRGTEWAGGAPTDFSILVGWTYASPQLAHCNQTP